MHRYGRKKLLLPNGFLQVYAYNNKIFAFTLTIIFWFPKMVFAIGCGFVKNYYVYLVVRFLMAVNDGGAHMIGFVMGKRKDYCNVIHTATYKIY